MLDRRLRATIAGGLFLAVGGCASSPGSAGTPVAEAAGPVTVQPGAPGQATRSVSAGQLVADSELEYTEADVTFMKGMIPHHAQALVMTRLVRERSVSDAVRQMALRMDISQRDEIALMERWLKDRGETPPGDMGEMDHSSHGGMHAMMPGMLSQAQLDQLATAEGDEFDRLFLEFMIQHHEGAIVMVDDLFSAPGGGQASEVFQLASHIDADQRMEIARMRALLDAQYR